ncbi:hypothetical protein AA313_de0201071 [Arthrobotrys entomopaga]|nr:hypothetical protein AA313_de0201071 [Arthrobotrys entomopaga]
MKFAKQLEDNLVPEWRIKYLNYKGAKKKLKAVQRAIRNAEAASASTLGYPSPHIAAGIAHRFRSNSVQSAASSLRQHLSPTRDRDGSQSGVRRQSLTTAEPLSGTPISNGFTTSPTTSHPTPGKRKQQQERLVHSIKEDDDEDEFDRRQPAPRRGALSDGDSWKAAKHEEGDANERIHLNPSPAARRLSGSASGYGAISPGQVPPRPKSTIAIPSRPSIPPDLDLPEPARPLEEQISPILRRAQTFDSTTSSKVNQVAKGERTPRFAIQSNDPTHPSPHTYRPTDDTDLKPSGASQSAAVPRSNSHPIFKSVFGSLRHRIAGAGRHPSIPNLRDAQVYLEMTEGAQKEFFNFLAAELQKINEFYEMKETEAKERLARIEQQISIMTRNRIFEKERERQAAGQDAQVPPFDWKHPKGLVTSVKKRISMDHKNGVARRLRIQSPTNTSDSLPTIAKLTESALETAAGPAQPHHIATTSSALNDYTRRTETQHVRYRTAKRKLKAALIEYYHSLELLKSYSLLNREGFRKILKKFDKTAHTHIAGKYLEEKVHSTTFASSEEVEKLIARTEDIYATHYEKGRRKHAVERLRTHDHKRPATGAMFRGGYWIGMAMPLFVQALYEAYNRLSDGYGMRHESQTGYLLQIWAGFALPTVFMMLFSLCCRAWVEARINYVFIFEFDTRNNLDWRELLELPSMFAFIQAVLMWFSFTPFWGEGFDRIWFPLIYVSVILVIILNPFKFCYYHSRKWLLYTLYRLFWAGFYPVEFRDFWSGDIFCSLTYTISNIPLFFCLWSQNWDNPEQCNSSHSRVLGFFTTIPSIWRLMQCFRRYHDTHNAFPHLANGAKYTCGILYYMTLSMWRIDKGNNNIKAAFILFAALNSLYTSTWDILMDWSLLNWYAPYRLLRTELAFRRPIVYYFAMLVDPLIRFSWIFYMIFVNEVQHSALLSFLISLAELLRRFLWCFFRMENEHCANVNKFRAYKDDVPLPYNVPFTNANAPPSRNHPTPPTLGGKTPRMTEPRVTGAEARLDEEIAAVSGGLNPFIEPSTTTTTTTGRRPSLLHTGTGSPTVAGTGTGVPSTPRAMEAGQPQFPPATTGGAAARRTSGNSLILPDRTPLLRAYTLATTAHAQDFERKRPPTGTTAVLEEDVEETSTAAGGGGGVGGAGGAGGGVGVVVGSAPGRYIGYLGAVSYDDDDDDDTDSESEGYLMGSMLHGGVSGVVGEGTGAGVGVYGTLADDAVEGMAGLSLRRTGTRNSGEGAGGDTVPSTGFRGTSAVLSPGIGPSTSSSSAAGRFAYAGRDYERRSRRRRRSARRRNEREGT